MKKKITGRNELDRMRRIIAIQYPLAKEILGKVIKIADEYIEMYLQAVRMPRPSLPSVQQTVISYISLAPRIKGLNGAHEVYKEIIILSFLIKSRQHISDINSLIDIHYETMKELLRSLRSDGFLLYLHQGQYCLTPNGVREAQKIYASIYERQTVIANNHDV